MYGYSSNASCLKNLDYELYQVATKWPARHQWGRKATQVVQIKPYTELMLKPIEEDPTRVNNRVKNLGRPDSGERALHICAGIGDLGLARRLVLELSADVNIANDQNETPIFYATRAGHYEVIDFLLECGANVTEVSTMGHSILHCVASMEDERAAGYALIFAELGAKLHTAVEEISGNYLEHFFLGAGIPLFWAALKNKPLLFASLAELHCNPRDQLSPLEYYVLLQTMAKLNIHGKSQIEILKPDGLSTFCALQDIAAMLQDKRPPHVAYGNCIKKPEPPDDYVESLQSSISTTALESCDFEEPS